MPSDALGSALADADGCYLGEAIAGTGGAVHIRWSKWAQTTPNGGRCSPVAVGELRRHPGERSGHIVPFCIQPDSVPRVLSMAAWINGGLDR